ncbi:hypothetical protein [Gaoshiqia sediminis]|uniref:Uncharacterized protein n=1 Tax=Gaoshiqia sediminis TaxID=2986998 RepID=A0AA41YAL4_9BACT|nr:hypothetical protein [Gaoshiqia sediminis]MCW0484078.1 hypothetical protein [Gaoshiqia sediminis]
MGLIISIGKSGGAGRKVTEATHAYGYQVDTTSKSKYVTRIGNLDLHRTLPIQNRIRRYMESHGGQFLYWLHPHDSTLKADGTPADLSGATGNVKLYKPGYYFKLTKDGNVVRRMFSEFPITGYLYRPPMSIAPWYSTYDNVNNRAATVCSLQFDKAGEVLRDEITDLPLWQANAAQFRGGNNSSANDAAYNSLLGMGRTAVARADIRSKCAAIGAHHGTYRAMSELAQLQTLEYGNYDIQEAYDPSLDVNGFRQGGLGRGPAVDWTQWTTHNGNYPFVPGGVTAKLGNNSGVVNYTVKNWANTGVDKVVPAPCYRGFETWYEYLWLINDDSLVYHQTDLEGGKVLLYVCADPSKFAYPANETEPTPPTGYDLKTDKLPTADGWGWNEADNEEGDMLPVNTGATSVEGICDYFWRNPTNRGWFCPLLSGNAAYGSYAGSRGAHANSRATDAHAACGFRLCRSNPVVG